MLSCWRALAVSLLHILAAPVVAQSTVERPDRHGPATEVRVGVIVLDIHEVDSAQQRISANVGFMARWHDPRLAHDGPDSKLMRLDEIWSPNFQVLNRQSIIQTMPHVVDVMPDGEVVYRQRIWGGFSQRFDLREFPFDRQTLRIPLVSASYSSDQVVLIDDDDAPSGVRQPLSLPDWRVLGWSLNSIDLRLSEHLAARSTLMVTVDVARFHGYYIFKIFLPLLLIVIMAGIAFWIDPSETGPRISVAVTSMLTLIAYRFMIGHLLPVVSYLTTMDVFILGATTLVFLTLIQAVTTSFLAKSGRAPLAMRLDKVARLAFAAAVLALFGLLVLA